jgi:hypothetical protein
LIPGSSPKDDSEVVACSAPYAANEQCPEG